MESESPSPPVSPVLVPGEGEEPVLRLLESITDGFFALDAAWRFTFVNDAGKRILAPHLVDPAELLGHDYWEAFPSARGTLVDLEFHRAVREGVAVEFEEFYPPWSRWFSVRAYPIRDGGLSVYFRDVTEERHAAEALRASEERYRSLFNSIDEGFCVLEMLWDEHGRASDYRFVEVNPAFERQTDLREPVGRTARELIPNLESQWFEIYGRVARTGEASRFLQRSEAMGRWFDVYAFPTGTGVPRNVALLFRDITERRRAEAELIRLGSESRARLSELQTLLDVLPIGIGIALDRQCSNIQFNPAFARILGIHVDGRAPKTSLADEERKNFRVIDDAGNELRGEELPMQVAAREGREVHEREINVVHVDGRMVRLLEYAAPLFDEKGQPRGSVGAFVDITERRQSEQRQRFLVSLDDAVRPLGDPEEIVSVAARLLGEHLHVDRCAYADVEPDQDTFNLTGNYIRDVPSIVGRYTFTQFGAEVLRLMRANQPYAVEDIETHQPAPADLSAYKATQIRAVICVPLHKGGRFVAAMAVHQKTPRLWSGEEVALVLHVANRCWEALERAKVTRVMEESEERFRTLADNIAQLAWMADAEGWIFWYNRRWFDYTGTTLEEMQGWGWEKVHHPEHIARVVEKWGRHLAAGEGWEDTFPLRGADGHYRWFLSRAFPIRDAHGKVLRWFGTNTDVTEQRAAADALARAKEEAEAASRAKDEFLAVLSHELRTPLTPVLLSAAALQDDEQLSADVRSQLAMMRRNIELEARLIDDLLDLTRITRGKLTLRIEECDVHSLLALALEIVRDEALARGLRLAYDLKARRTQLRCDPARIQQVFWNLFNNAVKYTPRGGSITVHSEDHASGVAIAVSDSGIGIAHDSLDRIFLPFEQAGLANNHRFGGLGLGLSISKTIVELHGGRISAESGGPNCGATFRVELPSERPSREGPVIFEVPDAAASAAVPPKAPPMRLLLVEDHEPTLAILARLLTRDGHAVATATTVAAARELAEHQRFDAVVSDIGLPDGTGHDLMKGLRASFQLSGSALTGYGMEEDQRRSEEAGFLFHLTKPVELAQLRRALAQLALPSPSNASPQ